MGATGATSAERASGNQNRDQLGFSAGGTWRGRAGVRMDEDSRREGVGGTERGASRGLAALLRSSGLVSAAPRAVVVRGREGAAEAGTRRSGRGNMKYRPAVFLPCALAATAASCIVLLLFFSRTRPRSRYFVNDIRNVLIARYCRVVLVFVPDEKWNTEEEPLFGAAAPCCSFCSDRRRSVSWRG